MEDAIEYLQAALKQVELAEAIWRLQSDLAYASGDNHKGNLCVDHADKATHTVRDLKNQIGYMTAAVEMLNNRNKKGA